MSPNSSTSKQETTHPPKGSNPLNVRDYAIYKQVWRLSKAEIAKLSAYYLLRTTGAKLDEALIEPSDAFQPFKLKHQNTVFHVDFIKPRTMQTGLDHGDATKYLISCRIQKDANMYIALIREIEEEEAKRMDYTTVGELESL